MRVHPAPNKRNIAFNYEVNSSRLSAGGQKKLRRLPHIFSKVLELPFASDADVGVEEGPNGFKFTAATEELDEGVRAHAIEIYPGVLKVVVREEGGDMESEMEMDRWRFRLPSETRPRLATAEYVDGELIVNVPKGVGDDEEERGEFEIGQLVLVQ